MHRTTISLLEQLRSGDEESWREADELYRPLIASWLRNFFLRPEDLEDLTQDVMVTIAREIGSFDHLGHAGAFRGWLKTITVNRGRAFLRSGRLRIDPEGGSLFREMMEQLADTDSEVSRRFDREHDACVIARLLEQIKPDFAEQTMEAFQLHVVQGKPAKEVADRLGVSRWAVYQAKSRVLRRLRELMGPWAEELEVG